MLFLYCFLTMLSSVQCIFRHSAKHHSVIKDDFCPSNEDGLSSDNAAINTEHRHSLPVEIF